MAWNEYRSHKIVRAAPIVSIGRNNEDARAILTVDGGSGSEPFTPNVEEMANKASVGDYAVIYEDGYRSVSPKAAFESGYTAISDQATER